MPKNIWVAAGDGDLERVKELIEQQSLDPNLPDPFTYTPMHAAASYGQLDVLQYLISRGGDVNITDQDGDTPLYTVENIETARLLVDHGATIDRRNSEGVSPIEHLTDDFPHIASFLQNLTPASTTNGNGPTPQPPSQHQQNAVSEQLTDALMASVEEIMQRSAAEGRDPDDELREAVGRAVLEGVVTGYQMTTDTSNDHDTREDPAKRARTDDAN